MDVTLIPALALFPRKWIRAAWKTSRAPISAAEKVKTGLHSVFLRQWLLWMCKAVVRDFFKGVELEQKWILLVGLQYANLDKFSSGPCCKHCLQLCRKAAETMHGCWGCSIAGDQVAAVAPLKALGLCLGWEHQQVQLPSAQEKCRGMWLEPCHPAANPAVHQEILTYLRAPAAVSLVIFEKFDFRALGLFMKKKKSRCILKLHFQQLFVMAKLIGYWWTAGSCSTAATNKGRPALSLVSREIRVAHAPISQKNPY